MAALLKVDIEPGECLKCPLSIAKNGICSVTDAVKKPFKNAGCPLMQIYTEEEKETPLSHIRYIKFIVRSDGLRAVYDKLP